jgi:hypothetical protein
MLFEPNTLSVFDQICGWFLIEHIFEDYKKTAGKFFMTNRDFRNLIKNLLIIIRNIVFWSHMLTLLEFLLIVSILFLSTFTLYYFFKTKQLQNNLIGIVISIYYIFITYVLLLKIVVSYKWFDVYFIFKPILNMSLFLAFLLFIYLVFFIIYTYIVETANQQNSFLLFKVLLVKTCFYLLSFSFICFCFLNVFLFLSLFNDNILQELIFKKLIFYIYVFYN